MGNEVAERAVNVSASVSRWVCRLLAFAASAPCQPAPNSQPILNSCSCLSYASSVSAGTTFISSCTACRTATTSTAECFQPILSVIQGIADIQMCSSTCSPSFKCSFTGVRLNWGSHSSAACSWQPKCLWTSAGTIGSCAVMCRN